MSLQASSAGGRSDFLRHHSDLASAEPLRGGRVTLPPSTPLHQSVHGLHPLHPQQPLHLRCVSHPGPQPGRWWIKWNTHPRTCTHTHTHLYKPRVNETARPRSSLKVIVEIDQRGSIAIRRNLGSEYQFNSCLRSDEVSWEAPRSIFIKTPGSAWCYLSQSRSNMKAGRSAQVGAPRLEGG